MPTKVRITRTAKRKDGNSKGTVAKRTTVRQSGPKVTISSSRSVSKATRENARASKIG